MRTAILSMIAAVMMLGCKNEPARDADPCERASENARRPAKADGAAGGAYGADPLPVERCRTLASRDEVQCIGYASSWDELTGCSAAALAPRTGTATTP